MTNNNKFIKLCIEKVYFMESQTFYSHNNINSIRHKTGTTLFCYCYSFLSPSVQFIAFIFYEARKIVPKKNE